MEPQHYLLLGGLFWMMVWGGVGVYVATVKKRSENEGLWFGALLGPLGVLLVAMLPTAPESKPTDPPSPYVHRPRKLIS